MSKIRYGIPGPTTIPTPTPADITTDQCPCGASYTTRNGDPDPVLYGHWLDHHDDHFLGAVD